MFVETEIGSPVAARTLFELLDEVAGPEVARIREEQHANSAERLDGVANRFASFMQAPVARAPAASTAPKKIDPVLEKARLTGLLRG